MTIAYVCSGCRQIQRRLVVDWVYRAGELICFGTISSFHRVDRRKDHPGPYDDLLSPQRSLEGRSPQGHRSQMTLSPLALVVRDLGLYLVAWIPKYANLRVLHLSRVVSAKVMPDKAQAPAGFDIDAYVEQGDFQLGGELAKVRLRFEAFAGHAFLDSPIAADQAVLQVSDAGEVELTATMRLSPQFVAWLLGFGDRVEVKAPEGLREEIDHRLRAAWVRDAR